MKAFKVFLATCSLVCGVFALDVTLYGVEASQSVGNFATTVSAGTVLGALPVGVANDGATVYVVTEVQSLLVYQNTQTTQTVLSTPTTVTYNFKADSTKVEQDIVVTFSGVVGVGYASCVLDGDGGGQCGAEIIADVAGVNNPITVLSTTYTGKAQPFFTLNNVQTQGLPSLGDWSFSVPSPTSKTMSRATNLSGSSFRPRAMWFFMWTFHVVYSLF
ncbi:hypothetical protein K443DRAFT_679161 [Laccaria amethystina LaAM-08-1]|uniref:Uncharacterized protein n=1 Tax=Laccaria amethystina LaAM-08-1 TaxID=1095629 RepID=A0A0C9XRV7_9AGAR|nr:hypothetical protein K443DRAFT_679161 [Laccaria amethystina LaAM-08-1]